MVCEYTGKVVMNVSNESAGLERRVLGTCERMRVFTVL
jgi:hypothetical protein